MWGEVASAIGISYFVVWGSMMISFVFSFQGWADMFESEIRLQRMTTDEFCKWIGVRIALWPFFFVTIFSK